MKPTIISNQNFYGGIAADDKIGIENSHAYSRSVDFRKKPSQLSPLPEPRRIGSNNIVDLIQNIIQVDDGTRYGLGDAGYFYSIDANNNVVVKGKLDDGAAGMLYRRDLDEIYLSSSTTVSRYGKLTTGTPTLTVNKYDESASTDSNAVLSGGSNQYTLQTSISESSDAKQEFESDIEPLTKIRVQVYDGGTGNWTLTLHDDANNELATSTVTNANITDGTYLDFEFSSQIRLYVKPSARTYHFHLTSTVADGKVICSTAGDLNTCDYQIYAARLIDTDFHPIAQFLQYTCVGNERYLSVWEPLSDDPSNLEWKRHRLDFGAGYSCIGLAVTDEFLVCAVEKRSTSQSRSFQNGRLFFWDGLSETYSFFIEVSEGSPESLFTYQNIVYMVINGALYVWPGGKTLVKIRTLLNTDTEFSSIADTTRVYPNMMSVRRNILLLGYPSITSSQTMEHGIFSWGAVDKNFPNSFGYNYVISTGQRTYDGSNALRLGCLKSFGDSLYISWRDDSESSGFNYGLDVVDNDSTPASSGTWEGRIYDGEAVFKQKIANDIKLTCKELPADVTIRIKYKIDRASSWTYPDDGVLTEGDTYKVADINSRFHEIQVGFDWESESSEPFIVTGIALDVNLVAEESPFTEL